MGHTRTIVTSVFAALLPIKAWGCAPHKLKDKIDNHRIIEQARLLGAKDPHLVLAIVERESLGKPKAFCQGTYGLMQLKLNTARYMGFRGSTTDLYDWKKNLRFGVLYLDYQLDRYDGDLKKAVSAFNAGHALVKQGGRGFVNDGYVNYVLAAYKRLKLKHKSDTLVAYER